MSPTDFDENQIFNPERMKLARQRLGMSRTHVAELSGISVRALTDHENGKKQPLPATVNTLAAALEVSPGFLYQEHVDVIPLETVSFRKASKTTIRARDAVLAQASLTREMFSAVERVFRLPEPNIPTFDKTDPEAAAQLVRETWKLGDRPISNMVHLLESKGARIASIDHKHADIDAFCFERDSTPYIFLNTSKTPERQRFDVAHELGHLVMHSEQHMEPADSKDREREANRFAAALLMPATAVYAQNMNGATTQRILAAKGYWKVSAMALTHRLHELELLTDWQHRSAALELTRKGYRTTEPDGLPAAESSQLLRKVLYGKEHRIPFRDLTAQLGIFRAEVAKYVRGLAPVALTT